MAHCLRRPWLVGLLAVVLIAAGCASDVETAPVTPISGDAASHVAAAGAALDRADLSTAEREYRNALALDSNSAAAQFGLGNVLVRQNRFSEAESAYKAALALDPNNGAALANLGVVYYQMGQLSRAGEELEAALRIEPNDPQTLYLLAAVRLQESNLEAAEPLLLKARDLNPDLPEVYYGLGVLYKFRGQTQEAIAAFEKFLAIGPGQDPSAMDNARTELKALKGQ